MSLETSECIPINNDGRQYTDCMEFSFLRFLHLMKFDVYQINQFGYSKYSSKNKYLEKFIKKYDKIYSDIIPYFTSKEREDWAVNVSNLDFFEYYRNDQAELFTHMKNILVFIEKFMDIEVDYNKPQDSLNKVAKKFSTNDKKILINIAQVIENYKRDKMKNIIMSLSRPDNEYKNYLDEEFNYVKKTTKIFITINKTIYEWSLFEYIIDSYKIKNKFITGHSVIDKIKISR